ncbi:MAG: flagellar hook capping FlgD N-terminal domain-containing protein [Pseudomonadota bacterium]
MEVSEVATTTPTTGTSDILGPQTEESEEMSEFLLLLTAQIENQDPLEPLDANQFVEQLAMINALEQQIETNSKLDDIIGLIRTETEAPTEAETA